MLLLTNFGITDVANVPLDLSADDKDFIRDFNSRGFSMILALKAAYAGNIFAQVDLILITLPT